MKKICLALLLTVAWTRGASADPVPFNGELKVILWKSLPTAPGQEDQAKNMILDLEAENGNWKRVYALAQSYNNATHEGCVTSSAITGTEFKLRIDMAIGNDQWVKGGHAGYDVVFHRDDKGELTGTFNGVFKGIAIKGKLTGHVKPPRPVTHKDYVPLDPDEHPRVLFRKRDIPALRERLNTPLGQAYLAQAGAKTTAFGAKSTLAPYAWDPINCGILYQLTGDATYAANARTVIERQLSNPEEFVSDFGGGSGSCGHRVVWAALTLDLCWDAWPEDFRKTVTDRLREELPNLLTYVYCTSHANTHPCSNYYGPGFGGPSIAALALWGLKGPEPVRPVSPLDHPRTLTAPSDFKPGDKVPTVEFVPGTMPAQWLMGGPAKAFINGDPLGQLGGSGQARPFAGATATHLVMEDGKPRSLRLTFDPMDAKYMRPDGVDLVALAGGENNPVTVALFAALKVNTEQTIGFIRGQPDTQVWLGNTLLNPDLSYKLSPGLYPLVITHATEQARGFIKPLLVPLDHPGLKPLRDKDAMDQALWRLDHDYWKESGGRDPKLNWALDVSRQRMYQHYRLGVGDGGWQAEAGPHYSDIAIWYPLNYASLYYKMFGRHASPYPDITHNIPRRMMQTIVMQSASSPDPGKKSKTTGKPLRYQPLSSSGGFGVYGADLFRAAFPIIPAAYKPAALWTFNEITDNQPIAGSGLPLALGFLHVPTDITPEHPSKLMPKTWAAPTFGFYCFRNDWESDDAFVGQVFAKASPVKGWNHPDAGTFRLLGLGHVWTTSFNNRVGFREHEPVVLLPLDSINELYSGQVTHLRTEPDGSGSVTINLDDVYSAPPVKGQNLYDSNLLRMPENRADSGITGLRAVAFDYSGKSGAPCLFVLVDKITGAKERWWQWTMDDETIGRTKLSPNGFTVDYGDASLVATFVTPTNPKVEIGTEQVRLGKPEGKRGYEGAISRVKVAAMDNFYLVATIQRKDAPAVKVEGTGLDAKITVGTQTIRFDGEKIAIGQ